MIISGQTNRIPHSNWRRNGSGLGRSGVGVIHQCQIRSQLLTLHLALINRYSIRSRGIMWTNVVPRPVFVFCFWCSWLMINEPVNGIASIHSYCLLFVYLVIVLYFSWLKISASSHKPILEYTVGHNSFYRKCAYCCLQFEFLIFWKTFILIKSISMMGTAVKHKLSFQPISVKNTVTSPT